MDRLFGPLSNFYLRLKELRHFGKFMSGDVIGKPGRDAVRALLPDLRPEKAINFVICNGENTAGGYGITADTASELLGSSLDV